MEKLKSNKKRTKWIIIITIIIMLLVIVSLVCYFFLKYKRMEEFVERNVIYEGISIEGIAVGGLSKEEAHSIIKEMIDEQIFHKEINIFYKDKSYIKPYDYFEFKSNYEDIVNKAYNLFKTGTIRERYEEIKKLDENTIDYSIENVYNEEKIKEFISSIKNDFNIEPKNAIIHRKNKAFIIEEEIIGLKLDIERNTANLKAAIDNYKEELELAIIETKPKYTKEYYSAISVVLGEYSTTHNNNQLRTQNLRIASNKINGTILHPGEDFATHVAISPITAKNGYQEAPIIIQGEVKDGLGGGICQVATTLYNAVLFSELKVIERQNHSMPVSYIEKGKDATMSGNHIDFVFENSTNYPIYLESFLYGGKLYMRIYGKDERSGSRKLKFQSDIIQKIPPPKATYVNDNTLEEGKTVVKRKAINGYKVKLYKLVYVNDKLMDKQLVNTSYYKPVGAIIRVGTKKTIQETFDNKETVETIKIIENTEVENVEDHQGEESENNEGKESYEEPIDETVIEYETTNDESMNEDTTNEEAINEGVDNNETGEGTGDNT